MKSSLLNKESKISPSTFTELFPFHMICDENLYVSNCGKHICRLFPELATGSLRIDDIFKFDHSNNQLTLREILAASEHAVVLTVSESSAYYKSQLKLKGQIILLEEAKKILFVGSSYVNSFEDLMSTGLSLSDLSIHDARRYLILCSTKLNVDHQCDKDIEKMIMNLEHSYQDLHDQKRRTDKLLYSVLPPQVASDLRNNRLITPLRYPEVTVLFAGISSFGEVCVRFSKEPMKIVELLNLVFTTFDELIDESFHSRVFKVETVNDKYMAVSGIPDPTKYHAR